MTICGFFYTFFSENVVMDFFERIKTYARLSNTTIESFIAEVFEGDRDRDSYNGWKRRGILPRAGEAIKIAKAMKTTVEELVEGEAGVEYVREWARRDGKVWQAPEAIADIVEGLKGLKDRDLDIIRGTLRPMRKGEAQSPAVGE
jgi:hypothetical protein